MRKLRVAVLMGGTSSERAISLSTGNQIVTSLDPQKYDVIPLDSAALLGETPPELPPAAAALARSLPPAKGAAAEMTPIGLGDIASTGAPIPSA